MSRHERQKGLFILRARSLITCAAKVYELMCQRKLAMIPESTKYYSFFLTSESMNWIEELVGKARFLQEQNH